MRANGQERRPRRGRRSEKGGKETELVRPREIVARDRGKAADSLLSTKHGAERGGETSGGKEEKKEGLKGGGRRKKKQGGKRAETRDIKTLEVH